MSRRRCARASSVGSVLWTIGHRRRGDPARRDVRASLSDLGLVAPPLDAHRRGADPDRGRPGAAPARPVAARAAARAAARRARGHASAGSKASIRRRFSRSSTTSTRCSTTASSGSRRARGQGRRSRARLEDAAGGPRAGSRARGGRRPARARGGDRAAGRTDAAADRLSPGARARRRARARAAGVARVGRGRRPKGSRARCSACTPIAASRFELDVAPDASSSAWRAKISTRCSATCSTTRASGRGRVSSSPRLGATRTSSSTWTMTGRASIRRCERPCCSAACAPTKPRPDSGLGLAIVRDLAELYGGSIRSTPRRSAACARGWSCLRAKLERWRL